MELQQYIQISLLVFGQNLATELLLDQLLLDQLLLGFGEFVLCPGLLVLL